MTPTSSLPWTTNYLMDELKQHLAKREGNEQGSRKYYDQAKYLIYRIGLYKPTPSFKLYLSDLTPELVQALCELDKKDRNYVLKQAVGRLFEDINSRVYHTSVSSLLEVKLEK